MMTAMKQVMSNCIVGQQLDLDRMPSFDIEYIFLQLRSESVGNQVELMLKHKEECEATEVKINLREVKVHINKDLSNEIMLDDKVGIRMRYPTLEMMEEFGNLDESQVADSSFLLIEKCIDSIYTADGEVHEADNVSKEELSAFINSMNSTQFQKVQKFFEDMPTVRHVIKVPKCVTCGQPFEQVVQGLQSFF
tara:strand:- start:86 stop:664 length:579 start_codon:yes stop_codon:yes gene_type:complete